MSDQTESKKTVETATEEKNERGLTQRKPNPIGRVVFLIITAVCFAYLYYRLNGAAMREGLLLTDYMTQVFANVAWGPWLALMMGYSLFYFAIDTLVVTRALNWFLADIKFKDILPIRASAYIISIFNEQIGKGAKYLKEGMEVNVIFHNGKDLEVELPISITLKVTETDPGVKGDTASGGTKPAILETGAQVMVPLFISVGEMIKVDTRNDTYLGREN